MNERADVPPTVTRLPAVPELLYDGQCSVCTRWAKRWSQIVGCRVRLRPLQEAEAGYPELRGELRKAIHLVEPDGRVTCGAEAILRSLALGRSVRSPLWVYERCGVARRVLDGLYRWVAAHRCRVGDPPQDNRARTKAK